MLVVILRSRHLETVGAKRSRTAVPEAIRVFAFVSLVEVEVVVLHQALLWVLSTVILPAGSLRLRQVLQLVRE